MKKRESLVQINGIKHWVKKSLNHNLKYPLIIVHGGPGGSQYIYERIPGRCLEQELDVIYYEQRGCGRSEKAKDQDYLMETLIADLNSLILDLGYEKVILLGFSFGAELVVEYTLKHPKNIHKIILQSPSDLSNMKLMYEIQKSNYERLGVKFINLNSDDIVENYNEMWNQVSVDIVDKFLFRRKNTAISIRNLWDESKHMNNGLIADQVFNRNRDKVLTDSSSKIEVETLIIVGKYDNNVGRDIPLLYKESIKKSKMFVFDESGHFPDYEEYKKYSKIVIDFCKQ